MYHRPRNGNTGGLNQCTIIYIKGKAYEKSVRKVLISLTVLIFAVYIGFHFVPSLFLGIGISQGGNEETFLISSQSADGKYQLNAYRSNPGATVDFSVKVYLTTDKKQKLIYNCYHEQNADIIWLDNSTVSINGKVLDLSVGEKYDWRK